MLTLTTVPTDGQLATLIDSNCTRVSGEVSLLTTYSDPCTFVDAQRTSGQGLVLLLSVRRDNSGSCAANTKTNLAVTSLFGIIVGAVLVVVVIIIIFFVVRRKRRKFASGDLSETRSKKAGNDSYEEEEMTENTSKGKEEAEETHDVVEEYMKMKEKNASISGFLPTEDPKESPEYAGY